MTHAILDNHLHFSNSGLLYWNYISSYLWRLSVFLVTAGKEVGQQEVGGCISQFRALLVILHVLQVKKRLTLSGTYIHLRK